MHTGQIDYHLIDYTEAFKDAKTMYRWGTKHSSLYWQTLPPPAIPSTLLLTKQAAYKSVVGRLDSDRIVDGMMLLPRVKNALKDWHKIYGNVGAKNLVLEVMIRNFNVNSDKTTEMVPSGPLGTGKTMMWMAAARFAGWTIFNVGADVVQRMSQKQSEN